MRRTKKTFITAPGDPAPLTLELKHRLAFSEVDALAIGWHGNYPRFFEMAHTELMRKIGLTYEAYRKNEVGAPIVQFHADYFVPLVLDELFTIRAEYVWSGGARINVNYEIIKENGKLAATGYTVQMLFDPHTHTPYITTPLFFQEVLDKWQDGELYEVISKRAKYDNR